MAISLVVTRVGANEHQGRCRDETKEDPMDAASLISNWNTLRKSIIQSQMSSVIILAVALYLVATGAFTNADFEVKLFAVVVLVTTGSLSLINQFAAVREGAAVVKDLSGSGSALEGAIAASARYVQLTQAVLAVFALAVIAVFALAIF